MTNGPVTAGASSQLPNEPAFPPAPMSTRVSRSPGTASSSRKTSPAAAPTTNGRARARRTGGATGGWTSTRTRPARAWPALATILRLATCCSPGARS